MRVLITSSRGKENLVKAFEDIGATVVKSLLEVPNLIIPTVDEELPFFADNREWFKSLGIEVMVASEFTISTCRDKAEFNLFCKRHGFQTPRTWQIEGYIKPRFGKGSKGITKIERRTSILQEHCPFPEVSIDYFADLDGKCISIVPRFRLDIVNGASTRMEIVPSFNFNEVKRIGKELGLVGHNVIQGFWTGEVFIFSEVNARFGGGSHLTFSIFNSPKVLMEKMRVC